MTDNNTPAAVERPFQREDRFIVIKRKQLNPLQEGVLRYNLREAGIKTSECVVIESDWPEYEAVWSMIEARVTSAALLRSARGTPWHYWNCERRRQRVNAGAVWLAAGVVILALRDRLP